MWKRMLIMLVVVGLFIAAVAYTKIAQIQMGAAMGAKFAPPPTAVTTLVVKPETWQPTLNSVGSLKAVNGVTVSTDLAGIVAKISFESGSQVKKGDHLVSLDTQQEDAQLGAAAARLELAKSDLKRKQDLVATNAIARSELDTAESQVQQMAASAEEMKALVARKRIAAPFDGVVGIRQVNVGQYLNPGAAIVSLQSLDPIYVEFSLPQQHLSAVAAGKKLRLSADGTGGQFEGIVTAIESGVDEMTRNFTVQGTIPNPNHKLRPGMFVNVALLLPEHANVLSLPSSSISYAPFGDSVFIVKDAPAPDGKPGRQVVQQFVKLGPTRGDQVTILSGVKTGDEVVTSGVFKLRNGAAVIVNNSAQPGNEAAPTPADN